MKKIFLIAIILITGFVKAQNVGINSTNPVMTFDVNGIAATASTVDGIRAPRITLAQLNLKTGYNTNHTGALLYVTDVAGGSTVTATAQVTTAGYYFFDGTAWQSVVSKAGSAVFIASLGNGNGSATATSITPGTFATMPLNLVKNVGGGVWSNNIYTVPSSGTYLIKSSIRLVDGSTSRNVFQAVHTSNADIPEGIWDTNSGNRWTMLYTRVAYFNKNDQLRLYVYSDGATANISDASLNIVLLSQN
ncbi:hypothetical protein NZ698_14310 [Chryseobacterium sp. PBS4-4]|uniref:C1q domain-containing protein n=1 Tax=Chryseobacterium edaphi TaxID=2976532 RepID=A0ABT2W829_9FLAO|nr:hypothetical protein [Chryseobacterium edaphi]MCU7618370.1 hypothetical protein [Chryseobacterium edaphi]